MDHVPEWWERRTRFITLFLIYTYILIHTTLWTPYFYSTCYYILWFNIQLSISALSSAWHTFVVLTNRRHCQFSLITSNSSPTTYFHRNAGHRVFLISSAYLMLTYIKKKKNIHTFNNTGLYLYSWSLSNYPNNFVEESFFFRSSVSTPGFLLFNWIFNSSFSVLFNFFLLRKLDNSLI